MFSLLKQINYKSKLLQITAICIVWLGVVIYLNPLKEFPLNDDWSYSHTVKVLVEQGRYELTDWIAGPQVTQTFWAYLFCLPFGFSFSALKLSTIVTALLGIIFTYLLVYIITKKNGPSALISILLAFNPLYLSLSITFMTDIHFYCWFVLSIYFFFKHLQTNQMRFWALGTLFSVFSMLTRQFGIVAPAAFFAFMLVSIQEFRKTFLLKYAISTFLTFISYWLYTQWLQSNQQLPENFRTIIGIFDIKFSDFLERLFWRSGYIITEVGLWLLPISIPLIFKNYKQFKQIPSWSIPFMLYFVYCVIRVHKEYPIGNIINNFYIGPNLTFDTYLLGHKLEAQALIKKQFTIIKVFATLGGLSMVLLFFMKMRSLFVFPKLNNPKSYNGNSMTILLLLIVIYVGIIMLNFTYFDRYLIPLILFFSITIYYNSGINQKIFLFFSMPLFLLFSYFSIFGTKDYIAQNTTKWELINDAITINNINPTSIDGGHEYNGWIGDKINPMGQWDISQKKYFISNIELEGYKVLKYITYTSMLMRKENNMYLLTKDSLP